MKKTSLFAVLCIIGLLMLPQAGLANMVVLADDQLCEVTGQAGIAAKAYTTSIPIDMFINNMPILNGVLTLSDITIKGNIVNNNQPENNLLAHATNSELGIMGLGMMGMGMFGMDMIGAGSMGVGTYNIDTSINLQQFSIGSIHVGNDLTGPSLGSLDIYGLHADIKGTITISTH